MYNQIKDLQNMNGTVSTGKYDRLPEEYILDERYKIIRMIGEGGFGCTLKQLSSTQVNMLQLRQTGRLIRRIFYRRPVFCGIFQKNPLSSMSWITLKRTGLHIS